MSVDTVRFELACVVGDIVEQFQFGVRENLLKDLVRQVREDWRFVTAQLIAARIAPR